jgi:hypothetical protein
MKNRDNLPDPMFMRIHQEFCPKQGGGGSKTEPDLSPVPEFWGNGARIRPGLGRLSILKMRIPGSVCLGGNYRCWEPVPGTGFFLRPGFFLKIVSEIFFESERSKFFPENFQREKKFEKKFYN